MDLEFLSRFFDGLRGMSIPHDWLRGFDIEKSFACVEGEPRIRFPNGQALGILMYRDGIMLHKFIRSLSEDEINETAWGAACTPWENYLGSNLFGRDPVTLHHTV